MGIIKNFREKFKRDGNPVPEITVILQVIVLIILAEEAYDKNWDNVLMCFLTLVLFMVPSILEKRLKIELPNTLEIIILLFIFSAEILGEVNEYYIMFERWDDMLHTMNGFLAAAIGFALIDMLNQNEKIKFSMTPFFTASFAFCFSMTVAVFWEFFEYGMDVFFGKDMQKDTWINSINSVALNEEGANVPVSVDVSSVQINNDVVWTGYLDIGLMDTMHDMFVNFIGAAVFATLGYIYIKNRGKGFASKFIPKLAKNHDKKTEEK